MNAKIKSYSALAFASAVVLPLGCSKDKNDADIVDLVMNKTITAVTVSATSFLGVDSIDINNDGRFDMGFVIQANTNDSTALSYAIGLQKNAQFLINNVNYINTQLNYGTIISSASAAWNYTCMLHRKDVLAAINMGLGGEGDKFIGFRINDTDAIPAKRYYGWMRINMDANLKTFTIKELAYHKLPDTPIRTGYK